MRVITENAIKPLSKSSVVTVGNFDGLHKGHQALIKRCKEHAREGQEVAVVCFEPLPQAFFRPEKPPARVCSVEQKIQLLEQSGVDLVWMMRFNQQLAQMPAETFAQSVFASALAASHVVIGNDFRFGYKRQGNLAALKQYGARLGFEVEAVADIRIDGERVSSTAIRKALAAGDMDRARDLLGRAFTMQGKVIRGLGLGRDLGYPTANMKLEAVPSPVAGVFAVQARIQGEGSWLNAVASLGRRPVVGGKEFLVEVHLFDFSADLYGLQLEVRFVEKIRAEEDFESMDDLIVQMKKDEARARDILTRFKQAKDE